MTRKVEPRAEPSNAPPEEHICSVCREHPVSARRAVYTDEASHVQTDAHLEAMAAETVREWLALPPLHPTAIGIAKQIARIEFFYGNYDAWREAMALPDTPEALLINRRIAAIWIAAIGAPRFEERMAYARKLIEVEQKGVRRGSER